MAATALTSRVPVLAEAVARTRAAVVAMELAAAAVTVAKSAPEAAAVPELAPVVAAATLAEEAAVQVAKCPPCLRLSVVLLDQCFAAVRPSLDSSR